MVLPTPGMMGGRTLADDEAIREIRTLWTAAAEAGANAALGLRTEAYQTGYGNPRLCLHGTVATCR